MAKVSRLKLPHWFRLADGIHCTGLMRYPGAGPQCLDRPAGATINKKSNAALRLGAGVAVPSAGKGPVLRVLASHAPSGLSRSDGSNTRMSTADFLVPARSPRNGAFCLALGLMLAALAARAARRSRQQTNISRERTKHSSKASCARPNGNIARRCALPRTTQSPSAGWVRSISTKANCRRRFRCSSGRQMPSRTTWPFRFAWCAHTSPRGSFSPPGTSPSRSSPSSPARTRL